MNFEKDIFISYAHIDNDNVDETSSGWISEFHTRLEKRLAQLLGFKPVIWRDAQLQGNSEFAPEILKQFQQLKVMVSVITPRYIKSPECKKELDAFFNAVNTTGGLSIENKWRLIKIIKSHVEFEELPEKIRPILDYKFYRKDSATGRFREFNGLLGEEFKQAYWNMFEDVANDIAQLIEKIDEVLVGEKNTTAGATTINGSAYSKRTIYLADTSYDFKEQRDNLKRELEEHGFTVMPNRILTAVNDIYQKEVETIMNDCSLSIHLIGSSYGMMPQDADKSDIAIQSDIAAQQSVARGLSRLIWMPASVQRTKENLLTFIKHLKEKEDLQHQSDLLEGTMEEFKFAIFDTFRKLDAADKEKEIAKEKAAAAATSPVAATLTETGDAKNIFLVCDKRDLDSTRELEDFLFDSGHNLMLPNFDDDQEKMVADYKESLRIADAVIIYYNNANDAWALKKISELKGKAGLGDANPLLASVLLLAGTSTTQKERFRSHDIKVENGLKGFDKKLLKDFLEKLK